MNNQKRSSNFKSLTCTEGNFKFPCPLSRNFDHQCFSNSTAVKVLFLDQGLNRGFFHYLAWNIIWLVVIASVVIYKFIASGIEHLSFDENGVVKCSRRTINQWQKSVPGYRAVTISSSAKCREKALVINIIGQQWKPSTKLDNPDGPIKPLSSMKNYRIKIVASCKKHAELLEKINAIKKELLELIDQLRSRSLEHFEKIDFGWICKDKNIYSSLPQMGGEEEYKRKYSIDGDELIGSGGSGFVYFGRRRSDNMKVAIKKVNKSNVFYWCYINDKLYPTEYCHLQIIARAGCCRIANLLDGFYLGEEYILVLETMANCDSLEMQIFL